MRRHLTALLLVAACTDTADAPATTTLATTSTTTADTQATLEPIPTTSATPPPDPSTTTADTSTSTTSTTSDSSSTTSDSSSTTNTTDLPEGCGNGVHDPGEQCDEGPGNDNAGSCTLFCKHADCGDGLLGPGEQCDGGSENKDGVYNTCQSDCTWGPRCGDGFVQPEEECDLGDGNGDDDEAPLDGVPCTQTCNHKAALVFLSDATFTVPELGFTVLDIDKRCQQLAATAGLWNAAHFKAWISTDFAAIADRLEPEIPDLPYALLNGQRIAKSRTALFLYGPEHGITITQTGAKLLDARIWTDTNNDGSLLDPQLDCDQWQTNNPAFKGRVGRSGVDENNIAEFQKWKADKQWTNHITLGCDHKYHLYCFED